MITVHVVVADESHPDQPPNDDVPFGVAVRVTDVLKGKSCVTQEVEQLKPLGLLATVPEPLPENANVNAGLPPPPPLELVKQTTFPVIYPVTMAPEDEIPPSLEFLFTVAEISVAPQASPVTVRSPDESTVIICGVLEFQITWVVMSFVTGG